LNFRNHFKLHLLNFDFDEFEDTNGAVEVRNRSQNDPTPTEVLVSLACVQNILQLLLTTPQRHTNT